MARPDQVAHGHYEQRLVRVYPERYAPTEIELTRQYPSYTVPLPAPRIFEEAVRSTIEFATEKGYPSGTIAKVVMVSRFGDCGLTRRLRAESGYDIRLHPECLEFVSEEECPRLLHEYDMGRLHPDHRTRT